MNLLYHKILIILYVQYFSSVQLEYRIQALYCVQFCFILFPAGASVFLPLPSPLKFFDIVVYYYYLLTVID